MSKAGVCRAWVLLALVVAHDLYIAPVQAVRPLADARERVDAEWGLSNAIASVGNLPVVKGLLELASGTNGPSVTAVVQMHNAVGPQTNTTALRDDPNAQRLLLACVGGDELVASGRGVAVETSATDATVSVDVPLSLLVTIAARIANGQTVSSLGIHTHSLMLSPNTTLSLSVAQRPCEGAECQASRTVAGRAVSMIAHTLASGVTTAFDTVPLLLLFLPTFVAALVVGAVIPTELRHFLFFAALALFMGMLLLLLPFIETTLLAADSSVFRSVGYASAIIGTAGVCVTIWLSIMRKWFSESGVTSRNRYMLVNDVANRLRTFAMELANGGPDPNVQTDSERCRGLTSCAKCTTVGLRCGFDTASDVCQGVEGFMLEPNSDAASRRFVLDVFDCPDRTIPSGEEDKCSGLHAPSDGLTVLAVHPTPVNPLNYLNNKPPDHALLGSWLDSVEAMQDKLEGTYDGKSGFPAFTWPRVFAADAKKRMAHDAFAGGAKYASAFLMEWCLREMKAADPPFTILTLAQTERMLDVFDASHGKPSPLSLLLTLETVNEAEAFLKADTLVFPFRLLDDDEKTFTGELAVLEWTHGEEGLDQFMLVTGSCQQKSVDIAFNVATKLRTIINSLTRDSFDCTDEGCKPAREPSTEATAALAKYESWSSRLTSNDLGKVPHTLVARYLLAASDVSRAWDMLGSLNAAVDHVLGSWIGENDETVLSAIALPVQEVAGVLEQRDAFSKSHASWRVSTAAITWVRTQLKKKLEKFAVRN